MDLNFKIGYCSGKAAQYAVEHWHYSKTMPMPPFVSYGVWENAVFVGAVIFSRGASKNIHRPFNVKMNEIAELTRIALSKHETPVSKIISVCLKKLKSKEPNLKLVISYADPNHGHLGKIYQASNWLYLGTTSKTPKFVDKKGRIWHSRQITLSGISKQFGRLRKCPKRSECEIIRELPKHKYAYPFDREIFNILSKLAKPYPKNASVV